MQKNIFENVPADVPEELFEELLTGKNFRMERITSDGQSSPKDFWYDQPENEWVLLLKGSAILELEVKHDANQTVTMKPGDYALLPSHQRHRVVTTDKNEKTIWLAIHFE